MSGFHPGPPFHIFGPGGYRGPLNFPRAGPCPPQNFGPHNAGPFKGFRNTYDNNPIGCLQETMQNQRAPLHRRHEHEEVVNEEWEDSDEWNDYDNLSHDEEEEDEDSGELSQANEVDEPDEEEERSEVVDCQDYRKDFDCESSAEEVAFSIYKADESGTLQQVGFGEPKKINQPSAIIKKDFPSRGWGQRFQAQSPMMGFPSSFGTFGDDGPSYLSSSPYCPPGPPCQPPSQPPVPLLPQKEIFGGSNTDLEYDGVLPNEMILKEEYFSVVKKMTARGNKRFTSKVKLPNGLTAVGSGPTKKVSKHNAARAMLDILEGRTSAVTEEVSQSITEGLKALRGDQQGETSGTKTFKPQFVCKQSEQEYLESQKKHQEEILKQSIEYGPLGVKLWFTGDSKIKEITFDTSPATSASSSLTQPNRAPSEPFNTDDDRFEKVNKGQFFIKGPVHNETIEDFIEKTILDAAWMEILKRDGKAENVCKLCNLVFKSKKYYDEHKYTDDHLHVCKGYFPGKGGFHCFLCWISFNQPEGLLNHVARANHQKRSKKKGVARIWMEPVANKSWDLINVHKHLEDCRREEASRDWSSRDEARRERGKRRSPDRWSHDRYEEEEPRSQSRNKLASDYKWREEKGSSHRERERRSRQREGSDTSHTGDYRERRSHAREERSVGHKSHHDSRSHYQREESRSHYREPSSSSSDLREILRIRRKDPSSEAKAKRKSRDRSEGYRMKKKSRRDSALSDHEEVNESQEDFEIDSAGTIENGEETLQKMKSAIIGILDEEIFALSKKK